MYIQATHLETRLTHIFWHHLPSQRNYNLESAIEIATITHHVWHS